MGRHCITHGFMYFNVSCCETIAIRYQNLEIPRLKYKLNMIIENTEHGIYNIWKYQYVNNIGMMVFWTYFKYTHEKPINKHEGKFQSSRFQSSERVIIPTRLSIVFLFYQIKKHIKINNEIKI